MAELQSYSITDQDLKDFESLTRQESVTVAGQIIKVDMIESMIRSRFEALQRSRTQEFRSHGLDGVTLTNAVHESLQAIRISRQQLGDGRCNLIVEKGNGDPDNEDPSIYRVMIPAHIDTVDMGAPTEFSHSIANTDRVSGQGVYDMGAAVLNNIDLAVTTYVPDGMKAYFVFTVDEEMHSIGARELIRQWDIWPMIDAVVSSEIGPVPPLPDGSPQMRLITARSGRIKFVGSMNIDPRMQGHGSENNMPNASTAMREFFNRLHARFYDGYSDPATGETEHRQQRIHSLLGNEVIEDGDQKAWRSRKGYVPPDKAEYDFAIKMVPPSTQMEYALNFSRWARGIAKAGNWSEFGISNALSRNGHQASYSPYEMPQDHPLVKVARTVIERISGLAPEIVGAPSVADECDYAEAGKPVITIPINGDEAHHPDEWVSLRSMLEVREVVRALLQDEDGFRSLMAQQAKKG